MKNGKYQIKDIPIIEVLHQQHIWWSNNAGHLKPNPFTYEVLAEKYGSQKLIFRVMEKLCYELHLLECGVSLRTAWLTEEGKALLQQEGLLNA